MQGVTRLLGGSIRSRGSVAPGRRAGESPPSGIVEVLVAPRLRPLLAPATRTSGTAGVLLQLTTDLPVAPSPAGAGTLTIASVVGTQRTVIVRLISADIPVGPAPTAMGPPANAVLATRSAAVAGKTNVTVVVPAIVVPLAASGKMFEQSIKDIKYDSWPRIADMGEVIDRRAADIHPHVLRIDGCEIVLGLGQGVEEAQGHRIGSKKVDRVQANANGRRIQPLIRIPV